MDTRLNTKRILIFLAFAVGIPWIAALVFYLTVGTDDLMMAGALANLVFISTPMLANVATRLITREGWKRLWLRPNIRRGWRFYLAAWLLPLLAASIGGGIFFLFFPQSFGLNLSMAQQYFPNRFMATNPWVGMLVFALQIVFLYGLVRGGLLSIGEEFGWRAYLLPKLMTYFTGAESGSDPMEDPIQASRYAAGARKASLLIGVIWGVWHWPLLLIGMRADPTMPLSFPLMYVVSTCAMSVLLCWATLRSGSVWPASIGHGMINHITLLVGALNKGPVMPLVGPTSGLIGSLGYIALALVVLLNRKAFTGEKKPTAPEMAQAVVTTSRG